MAAVKAFAGLSKPLGKYREFLKELAKRTAEDNGSPINYLLESLKSEDVSKGLIIDFKSAINIDGCEINDEKILKSLIAPALKSSFEIKGELIAYEQRDSLRAKIVIRILESGYGIGIYGKYPKFEGFEEEKLSDKSTTITRGSFIPISDEKVLPIPEDPRVIEMKKEIIKILLEEKISDLEPLSKIYPTLKLDYAEVEKSNERIQRLSTLQKELKEHIKNNEKLSRINNMVLHLLESKKKSLCHVTKEEVNKLNDMFILKSKDSPICHKCFNPSKEAMNLSCGHWSCRDCLVFIPDQIVGVSPVALKCPVYACFYVLESKKEIDFLTEDILMEILRCNDSCESRTKCGLCAKPSNEKVCDSGHVLCKDCARGYLERYNKGEIFANYKATEAEGGSYDMPTCSIYGCEHKMQSGTLELAYTNEEREIAFIRAKRPLFSTEEKKISKHIQKACGKCFKCGKKDNLFKKAGTCESHCDRLTCNNHKKDLRQDILSNESKISLITINRKVQKLW